MLEKCFEMLTEIRDLLKMQISLLQSPGAPVALAPPTAPVALTLVSPPVPTPAAVAATIAPVAPAVPVTPASPTEKVTREMVGPALVALSVKDMPAAMALLASFGVNSLADLSPDKYAAIYAEAQKAL